MLFRSPSRSTRRPREHAERRRELRVIFGLDSCPACPRKRDESCIFGRTPVQLRSGAFGVRLPSEFAFPLTGRAMATRGVAVFVRTIAGLGLQPDGGNGGVVATAWDTWNCGSWPSGTGPSMITAPLSVLPGVLSFGPEVQSMVLDCLPGVASVCAKLQQALRHSPAESRVPGPTQVANWARVLAIKQDAASV